jgi:hypothetical protein
MLLRQKEVFLFEICVADPVLDIGPYVNTDIIMTVKKPVSIF